MVQSKKSKEYRKVNVPESMASTIEDILTYNEELGFRSIDEFVRDAVRESIIKYNKKRG